MTALEAGEEPGTIRGGSWRGWLPILLLFVLVPLWMFRDAAFGRRVFYTQDILPYIEPKSAEIVRAVEQGRFPFWLPAIGCGVPFFAEIDNAVLNPFNLLLPLGPRRWVEVAAPLWCALAALALAALLAEWKVGRAASAVGGLAFGLSGLLVFYFDNPPYLNASLFLPAVLLAWHRALARRSAVWLGMAAATLAVMLTAGDVQTVYDAAGLALLYGFVVPGARRRLDPLAGWLVLGLAAVALAAVQLGPTLVLLGQAPRSLTLAAAFEPSFHPGRLLEVLLPFAWGKDLPGSPYWGQFLHPRWPAPWTRSVYMGLLPLAALPFAFAERSTRRLALLLAATGALAVAASMGPVTPLYGWLYHTLPLFNRFRSPAKLWIVVVVVLALLGGLGLDRLLRRGRVTWLAVPGLAALLFAGAAWIAPKGAVASATFAGPTRHLALAAALLVAIAIASRRLPAKVVAVLLVALQAVDLALVNGTVSRYFGDPRAAPATPVPAARAILADARRLPGPIRIYHHVGLVEGRGFDPPPGLTALEGNKLWDRISLDWNHAWTWGLEDAGGYTVLQDERPLRLRLRLRADEGMLGPTLGRLGVRYLVLPKGYELPRATRLVADVEGGAVRVAAIEQPLGRVFLARGGRIAESPDEALGALTTPAFDPRQESLLELPAGDSVGAAGAGTAPTGLVRLRHWAPGRVEVDIDVPEPRYLVLNEAVYAGWSARVDGAPRPTVRANYLMQAVAVRPGERRVELSYRPPLFVAGAVTSGLAWTALALLLVASGRRRRAAARATGGLS